MFQNKVKQLLLNHMDAIFTDEDVIRIGLELADGNMTDKQ